MCVPCGKPICVECKVVLGGKFYCNPCADKIFSSRVQGDATVAENTSGQGSSAVVPKEIRGWNWGAFLLTWIWAIGNKVWIGVLAGLFAWIVTAVTSQFATVWIYWLITLSCLLISIVLGLKGSEWAWQNKRWDSIEHFKRTQRKWGWWGLGVFVVG